MAELETWENRGNGNIWVWKADRFGTMKDELVKAGGKFTITTDERLHNQERAANVDQDIFRNGTLGPVKLIKGSEDEKELASNPNLIAESEMAELFSLHHTKFDERLASITNETVLRRLQGLAEDEETGATLRQVRKIEERIVDLSNVARPEDTTGARVGGERVGAGPSDPGDRPSKAHTP